MKVNLEFPRDWFQDVDKNVPGWCSPDSALNLWNTACTNAELGVIVEIGSAWGKSTIVLAEASRRVNGGPVFSIDPHTGGIGYLKQLGVDRIDSFPEFWANVAKFGLTDYVTPLVSTSEQAAALWNRQNRIRMLYIDGLHTPEAVAIDIQKWIPLVSKGGTVIFDDYHQPSIPMYRAKIDELLPAQSVTLPVETLVGGLVSVRKL